MFVPKDERVVAMLIARESGSCTGFGLEDADGVDFENDDPVEGGVVNKEALNVVLDQGAEVGSPAEFKALRGNDKLELELAVVGGLSSPAERSGSGTDLAAPPTGGFGKGRGLRAGLGLVSSRVALLVEVEVPVGIGGKGRLPDPAELVESWEVWEA